MRWISVHDALPDTDRDAMEYLVYDKLNHKVGHDYYMVPTDGGAPFWNHYQQYVTHWMALPDAPSTLPDIPVQQSKVYMVQATKEARDKCNQALAELEDVFGIEVPVLNIIDWRDLRKGDMIRCVGSSWTDVYRNTVREVLELENPDYSNEVQFVIRVGGGPNESDYTHWGIDFEFISRPVHK